MNTTIAPSRTKEWQKQKQRKGIPNRDPNPRVKPNPKA